MRKTEIEQIEQNISQEPIRKVLKTKPQQIFYNDITRLIRSLLIFNPNYSNEYYYNKNYGVNELLRDTKERASYILERIEDEKHLIDL